MLETVKKWANRATRRFAKKKHFEVIMRSESMSEVLENILKRPLNHESSLDMGLLEEFTLMNDRLASQPPHIKEKVRELWFNEIKAINAPRHGESDVLTKESGI